MSVNTYYSHGKLLLTGEYAVLDGAKALAFPCKLGQGLTVKASSNSAFKWVSRLKSGDVWNALTFSKEDIINVNAKDDFTNRLFSVLHQIYTQKPQHFEHPLHFSTHLEFDKNWGLGSSSTLINNLANWAKIDPYQLLDTTFGGSGYDIAAAKSNSPFIFQKKEKACQTKTIEFPKVLTPFIYFIYLNQKQNSREGIKRYRAVNADNKTNAIDQISLITKNILDVKGLSEFESLMVQHEKIIAALTEQTPVQESKFKDYTHGIVKSLGAWGGDFVLVTAKEKSQLDYFKEKGFNSILKYSELILDEIH